MKIIAWNTLEQEISINNTPQCLIFETKSNSFLLRLNVLRGRNSRASLYAEIFALLLQTNSLYRLLSLRGTYFKLLGGKEHLGLDHVILLILFICHNNVLLKL